MQKVRPDMSEYTTKLVGNLFNFTILNLNMSFNCKRKYFDDKSRVIKTTKTRPRYKKLSMFC